MSILTKLSKREEINMLEGPLLGKIFLFSLPLMATNILQMFYNAADMVVVGLSGVDGAIGAIGTTSSFCALLVNLFSGFGIGTGVVVARNIGAGDRDGTSRSVHTSLLVGLMAGLLTMAVGLFISRPVMVLMGDEGHILELATVYTRIYFIGIPFLALTNFETAILRAKGDTVTPLLVLAGSGLLNVILNLVFVVLVHMSVDGVATATAISNAFSAVILFFFLVRDKGWCRVEPRKLRIDRRALVDIIRDGVPAAIQGMVFSISNMLIQSTIISINNAACPGGSDVIDGRAAASSIEGFLYVATNSVAQAAVTFIGQNYGARQYKRIGLVMRDCYFVSCLVARVCSILILLLRRQLLSLYVTAPLAIETGETALFINVGIYELLACMEIGSSALRGMGKSLTSTIISLVGSCVLRVVWIYTVYPLFHTFASVTISYPISWALTAATSFTVSMVVRHRLMTRNPEERPAMGE